MTTSPKTQDASLKSSPRSVHLPGLLAFDSVARHMNFARAADEFGVTPTAMSRTIKTLEAQLNARLFNRTTRSVSMTEVGAQLLEKLSPALEQIRQSVESVGEATQQATGSLRINTSYVAYAALIEPHVQRFLELHPGIELEFQVDNALSDIVSNGFDAGIRLGHAIQRDMIGVPVGPVQRLVVVGSKEYLSRNGTPRAPQDLLDHNCIRQRVGNRGRFLDWSFKKGSKGFSIDVNGRLIVSEMRCALSAAVQGGGLAYVFENFAARELASATVEQVLEPFCPPAEAFYLYYANRAQMPGKLRAFIDFVQASNWNVPG
jgi:DNA-binding transcriptional LysR family regulator